MSWLSESFAAPLASLWSIVVVAVVWLQAWRDRDRARRLATLVGRRAAALAGERSPQHDRRRVLLALAGLLLCILAWMQPRFGTGPGRVLPEGTDLCVCLDVSRSMLARDHEPSRLAFAQAAIAALAARTRGDRLALVVFAGEARLRVPLTRDTASFVELVQATDPVDVTLGGTDLGAAIDLAVLALAAGQGRGTDEPLHGAVLLVTDGEDPTGSGRAAAERARRRGLSVHCAGIGSALGSKITITGADGRQVFLRDRHGNEVVSRLDAAGLRAIAAAGNGLFVDGGRTAAPLVEIYERGILPHLDPARAGDEGQGRANRFQLPLGLGIAALLLDLLLPQRRRRRSSALQPGGEP